MSGVILSCELKVLFYYLYLSEICVVVYPLLGSANEILTFWEPVRHCIEFQSMECILLSKNFQTVALGTLTSKLPSFVGT